MEMLLKWIAPAITLLLALSGGIFGYGKLSQRVKDRDERIDDLNATIYLPDGKWRFAPAEDVCGKLDKMDAKIDDLRTQQTNDMKEVVRFMGKVEEAIKKNGK